MQKLCEAAEAVGVIPDDEFRRRFTRYFELIEAANSKFNLTGARGWDRVRDELFIRSFDFLSPVAGGYVPAVEWFAGRRVLDVGTGAGVPGLVLKLAVPEMVLTLLDSSQKKTAFLRDVVTDLGLEDVEVVTGRAEEIGQDPAHRESYDLVVSRGVARLVELAELMLPFVSLGGAAVAAKGPDVAGELSDAEWAAERLGAAPAITKDSVFGSAGGTEVSGTMVYWMKIAATPSEYPRRTGIPHTRPLLGSTGQNGRRQAASST